MPDVDWSGLEPAKPKVDFSGIGPKVVDFSGIGPAPTMAQRFRPPGQGAPSVSPQPAPLPEGPKINRFKPETEADTVHKYFGNQATVGGALQNVWDAIKDRYAAGGALSHEGAQELREGKPVSGTITSLLGRGEQAVSPLTGAFDAASPYLPGLVGAGEGVPSKLPEVAREALKISEEVPQAKPEIITPKKTEGGKVTIEDQTKPALTSIPARQEYPNEINYKVTINGKDIGFISGFKKGNKLTDFTVKNMGGNLTDANTLGVKPSREVLRELQKLHPEITEISGDRLTGARKQAGQSGAGVTIKLPKQPESLSAAAAPPTNVPAIPTKPVRRGIENVMRRLEGGEQAGRMEFDKLTEALPAEAKTPEFGFKMRERDEDPSFPLTPEDEALRKQTYEPLKERERKNYEILHEEADEAPWPSNRAYTHRIRRGMGGIFERVREPFQESPIGPGRKQNLSRTPPSEHARSFFVLEDQTGNKQRILVHQEGNKLLAWENGKETPIPYGDKPLKLGETTNILGKDYKLVDARASEIEQHARDSEGQPIEYERNGFISTIHNIMQQEAAIRARIELKSAMQSPEGKAYFKFKVPNANPPKGFRDISGVSALSKYWVPNKIADDIEYFFNTADRSEPNWINKAWEKASRFVIGSIFWNPIRHIQNIGTQYAMARGEDWAKFWTPSEGVGGAYRSQGESLVKAAQEVTEQGPLYRKLVQRGSGQFFGRLMQQDFYPKLLKRFGEEIDKNPGLWRGLGLTGRSVMKVPHMAMWWAGDVMMTARVMELMKREGLSEDEAIAEAERTIPSYKVTNTSAINKEFTSSMFAFGRYHYDVIKSIANAAQDVGGLGKSWSTRRKGLAKLAVLGAITSYMFPILDEKLQKLTGISGLRTARTGAAKLVDLAGGVAAHYAPPGTPGKEWAKKTFGDKGFHDVIANSIMLNPIVEQGVQALSNLNLFTGKREVEPGQKTGLGAASTIGSQVLQGAAQTIAPVADVIRMWQQGLSPKEELIKQTVGNTTPKKKYVEPKGQQKSEQRRAEQSDWIGHLMKWLHAPANH